MGQRDFGVQFKERATDALESLKRYYASGERTEVDLRAARVDTTVLAAYTRFEQTTNAARALGFALVQALDDPKKLKEYCGATLPALRAKPD